VDRAARIVADDAGREALRARFLFAQSFSQDDPWAERAAGANREQHAHMAQFQPIAAE
jgi:nitrite reductase (NADH) large subunit